MDDPRFEELKRFVDEGRLRTIYEIEEDYKMVLHRMFSDVDMDVDNAERVIKKIPEQHDPIGPSSKLKVLEGMKDTSRFFLPFAEGVLMDADFDTIYIATDGSLYKCTIHEWKRTDRVYPTDLNYYVEVKTECGCHLEIYQEQVI